LKREIPYDSAIPLLGTYPKEIKSVFQRDICIPMFIAALFTIVKVQNQPKMWYICVNEILLSLRKEGNPAICDSMSEPEGHWLSEISQL
jgi:hypothetical protein